MKTKNENFTKKYIYKMKFEINSRNINTKGLLHINENRKIFLELSRLTKKCKLK